MAWNFRGETEINSPYANMSGYQSAYQQLFDQGAGLGSDSESARQQWAGRLDQSVSQFKSMFQNYVGRAATNDEVNQFLQQNAGQTITSTNGGRSETQPDQVRNSIMNYVSDTFQGAAKDYATQQLQGQQKQAASLADMYRQQGTQAINSTESMLQDYQKNLFDQLRPSIITSMEAQGLGSSGGFNEAMAGVQKDLAAQASGYLSDANLNMQNQANAIQFGGAAAPYQYQQGQIMNQVPYLQQQGMNALNTQNQYGFLNQQLLNSMALQQQQQGGQSNMLGQAHNFGSNFTSGFGSQLGQGAANSFGNFGNYAGFMGNGSTGGGNPWKEVEGAV